MIVGLGTDIIEIERVRRAVKREHFVKRVFTAREIEYCNSRGQQKAASYAARFAGKEAFFKAVGTGIVCALNRVEILNDERGKPYIELHDEAVELTRGKIHISLSHSRDYATAVCAVEI